MIPRNPQSKPLQALLRNAPLRDGVASLPPATLHLIADLLQEGEKTLDLADDLIEGLNTELEERQAVLASLFSEVLQRDCAKALKAGMKSRQTLVREACARIKALAELESSASGHICCGRVMDLNRHGVHQCSKCLSLAGSV